METKTELANSFFTDQLTTFTTTDLQKAWHISAVLLSLRRPVPPIELAIRCTLFHTTPELVEFLCSIPNSPLYLTPSYFVTFSSIGYLAIAEFVANSNVTLDFPPRLRFELEFKTYFRKRKRMRLEDDECLREPKKRGTLEFDAQGDTELVINSYPEAHFPDGHLGRGRMVQFSEPPMVAFNACQLKKAILGSSLFINSCNDLSKSGIGSSANRDEREAPFFIKRNEVCNSSTIGCQIVSLDDLRYQNFLPAISEHGKMKQAYPFRKMEHYSTQKNPVLSIKAQMNEEILAKKICFSRSSSLELEEQMEHPEKQVATVVHPCETVVKGPKDMESDQEVPHTKCLGNLLNDTAKRDRFIKDKQLESVVEGFNQMLPSTDTEKGKEPLNGRATLLSNSLSPDRVQLAKTFTKLKFDQKQPSQTLHSTSRTSKNSPLKQPQTKRDKKSISLKQHLRYNVDKKMGVKEKQETTDTIGKSSFISSHDQLEQRVLPKFESFIVEEEEGSGGYGTVYRARRKTDGVTFAIKSPHVNANRNHVHNELKMLERFGGKNFVIRYEGSVKSGNSDCLVLEHVEHDRPEVLKKEIDVCELQWYGYCMFRALAGLHKQGIVHRDVKPGNFLFNRKACKGYLIDFNLAMDLNHKYCNTGKTKEGQDLSYEHVTLSCTKPLPITKGRKFLTLQDIKETHHEQGKAPKPLAISKDMRKKIGKYNPHAEVGTKSIIKSQGADGSGITSAKDATSTKTPSAEKFREPLPCQGRKELINLVQEALQGANREAVNVPVSKRKRVAAPPGKVDHKFVYLTPMPLQSAGGVVGGAGLLKSKGDGKIKREGPCVGTKGFRAPEVLFRSQHQGPKVDIWSAGVTLLYLMIGRTPFVGDPDQNAKEIAKLRGSEDLWEVAKLHNRESSFPMELFDIKFLSSMKLRDWCKLNTRRPDFLEVIPSSLFDLVDKCLAVNPRLRISAEEALRHEFFTPCHEALRKHRMLRQGVSLVSRSFIPMHGDSQTCGEVS